MSEWGLWGPFLSGLGVTVVYYLGQYVVRKEVRRDLAQAWDKGNIAGIFDLPSEGHATPNPYRKEAK